MRAPTTIYHPITGATSVVPASAVPGWQQSGWTTDPAPAEDAEQAPVQDAHDAPPASGDDTGDVEPDAPTPSRRRPASGQRSSSSTSTEE